MVEENTIYDLANCQSQKKQKKTTSQICQSRHLQYNITAANRNILNNNAIRTLFAQYKQPKYRDSSTKNTRR